jgi:hypothetical protein
MQEIKSPQERWSLSLCSCSEETAYFDCGAVVLHISREDLRDFGIAMQSVARDAARKESHNRFLFKKGWVQ